MILVKPSYEILQTSSVNILEQAGRLCYKSEKVSDDPTEFIKKRISSGHESIIEHSILIVKFIVDRGVSHELVRHRLCAFSQESTRYCNYKGGVTFVIPPWLNVAEGEYHISDDLGETQAEYDWANAMITSEKCYVGLLNQGWSPQQARAVLPNSLKTEIIVTANYREWRHILKLRTSNAAHPQMREVMLPLQDELRILIPSIFN